MKTQMTQQIDTVLNDIQLKAARMLGDGFGMVNVQDWVGGVYVSLTIVRVFGVWTIGVPTPGEAMFVTDDVNAARAELVRLMAAEAVAA